MRTHQVDRYKCSSGRYFEILVTFPAVTVYHGTIGQRLVKKEHWAVCATLVAAVPR